MTAGIAELLRKYDRPAPRYTSYPTALQFDETVSSALYTDCLKALPADEPVSLYLHIPFCHVLCHYCGCFTKIVSKEEPMRAYADLLRREIHLARDIIGQPLKVSHLHWGGGSPNYLPTDEFESIMALLQESFSFESDAEIAMEMDPRLLDSEKIACYARSGINRASLGVQDFDQTVQDAIGRIQPFEEVARCVEELRGAGIKKINFDLMYGLPCQSEKTISDTIDLACSLNPDRLALFGYAHVPWARAHQKLLERHPLPNVEQRYALCETACDRLKEKGYHAIGIDHFAKEDDALYQAWKNRRLRRNFQGYTTDTGKSLIGFGASSISALPQLYAQNTPSIKTYRESLEQGSLPVYRGCSLSEEDMIRRDVIEQIMCSFETQVPEQILEESLARLQEYESDGLVIREGPIVKATEKGRPFVRLIATCFDSYLSPEEQRHARAV